MKLPPRLLVPVLTFFYRLWCSTLRIRQYGREKLEELDARGELAIVSIWHDELFTLIHKRGALRLLTVVSQSRDGEYLAGVLARLGIKSARGSSSRGGLAALLKAARLMREERRHTVITIDGPRGPRHKAKQGAVILAKRTPALILPVRLFPRKAVRFSSWDRFQLPLPFSRVDIVFGDPYKPDLDEMTEEALEKECRELEKRLKALQVPQASGQTVALANESLKLRLLRGVARLISRLPWPFLRGLANVMGEIFWRLAPARRELAVTAIQKHLGKSRIEAKAIARQSFRENFLSFLEIFHAGRFVTDESVSVLHGQEVKARLQAESAPVIIATAHLGSWELMPGLATDILPQREGMVVVRSQKDKALNTLMAELRGARGMLAIGHREASSIVVPKLRRGGVTAFLVDHNTARKEALFLPFLEDIAAVNVGPASLALRTKAAIYPVFLLRDGQGGHILHMLPPLHSSELEGSINERVRRIATFYTRAVEDMVRLYPEQWFWMHNRWKTREE
ncbi:DUF374 domain-containing protein [Desulfovibrio sp. OttesenSCG-928-F20]|nr:DUF374 domain-containing protein [Desulfovibrio sp. OttesenSCG-928-F20]